MLLLFNMYTLYTMYGDFHRVGSICLLGGTPMLMSSYLVNRGLRISAGSGKKTLFHREAWLLDRTAMRSKSFWSFLCES